MQRMEDTVDPNLEIKAARKRKGMTLQQLADAVGVTKGAVQQWEKVGGTYPTRKNYPLVAKILGLSVNPYAADTDGPTTTGAALIDRLTEALEANELSEFQIQLLDGLVAEFKSSNAKKIHEVKE